jgi:hypothetical protein
MSTIKPKRVYCFRVDGNDIKQAKRLRIKLGPALRAYIKTLISQHATLIQPEKEEQAWTIRPRL